MAIVKYFHIKLEDVLKQRITSYAHNLICTANLIKILNLLHQWTGMYDYRFKVITIYCTAPNILLHVRPGSFSLGWIILYRLSVLSLLIHWIYKTNIEENLSVLMECQCRMPSKLSPDFTCITISALPYSTVYIYIYGYKSSKYFNLR